MSLTEFEIEEKYKQYSTEADVAAPLITHVERVSETRQTWQKYSRELENLNYSDRSLSPPPHIRKSPVNLHVPLQL